MESTKIKRWGRVARLNHWVHLIAVLLLIYTGLALFVETTNILANPLGGFIVTRSLHRLAAVVFIVVPVIAVIFNWRQFLEWVRDNFTWGKDDTAWLVRFPLYFFRPSVKMPPVHKKSSSGQRVLIWLMLLGVVNQVITGFILWFRPFTKGAVLWATALHDVGFLLVGILLLFHIYVGLGIFKPYRGVWRGMLFDGKIDESLSEHLWPEWTEEQKRAGEATLDG